LGVSVFKVRALQRSGQLPSIREGDVYLFDPNVVAGLLPRMPTSSPPKAAAESESDLACFEKFENGYFVLDTAKALGLRPGQVLAAFETWKAARAEARQAARRQNSAAATVRRTASRRERLAAMQRADKDDAEWRAREDRRWAAFEKDFNSKWGRKPGNRQ
jgi:hypothetical protein